MKVSKLITLILSSVLFSLCLTGTAQAQTAQELRVAERRAERVAARRAERVEARVAARAESVPELDASGAPIALALLGGLAGIGFERRRRKQAS